jgi:predicted RNA-binding protein with PIN domain
MHYFIDGYNFLFQFYEEIDPLRKKRDDLIEYLQRQLVTSHLKITIVFDSHYVQGQNFPTRFDQNTIEIIYTPSKQTADGYILEALTWNKNNNTETVVTSDKGLSTQAKALGAHVQSIPHFIKKLMRTSSGSSKEHKHMEETPHEFTRLLEAFEKRLGQ